MTIFSATMTATYRDHDFDGSTPQKLSYPSVWNYSADYDPSWFSAGRSYPQFQNVRFVIKDNAVDITSLYTPQHLASLSRKQLALLKYQVWEEQNQTFGQIIDDPFNPGQDYLQTELVSVQVARDVTSADIDGTAVRNWLAGTYFGTITIDNEFFIAISGGGGQFTLFGSPADPDFMFPEFLHGPPNGTAIDPLPYSPIHEFTNGVDRWTGTAEDDIAGLLGGSDVANGKIGNDIIVGHGGGDRIRGGFGDDDLFGGSGRDDLFGEHGSDLLVGGDGGDFLDPGSGRDFLEGGRGDDDFIFANKYGVNRIKDFDAVSTREDIDLREVTQITDFQDLKADHMRQDGKHVVIDDLAGTKIIVMNTLLADLDRTDFIF